MISSDVPEFPWFLELIFKFVPFMLIPLPKM